MNGKALPKLPGKMVGLTIILYLEVLNPVIMWYNKWINRWIFLAYFGLPKMLKIGNLKIWHFGFLKIKKNGLVTTWNFQKWILEHYAHTRIFTNFLEKFFEFFENGHFKMSKNEKSKKLFEKNAWFHTLGFYQSHFFPFISLISVSVKKRFIWMDYVWDLPV